jgi:serine/threonine protein kinase
MANSGLEICETELLGKGAYATVFKGFFRGEPVAVKKVLLVHLSDDREQNIMQQLDHDHVLELLHVESDKDFR